MTKKILPFTLSKSTISFITAINQSWEKTTQGIIETCSLLTSAKDQLTAHEFKDLINNLPFSTRTAERFIAIGNDKRITTHVSLLPPSWGTIYEITRLSNPQFKKAIKDGVISPSVQRKEIIELLNPEKRQSQIPNSMFKAVTIYTSSNDTAAKILEFLQNHYSENDIFLDDDSFLKKMEREQEKEIQDATIQANKKALKIIKDFEKLAKSKCRINGRFDKNRFYLAYSELSDFLEGGIKQYYKLRCSNSVNDNPINFILSAIGHDLTTQDYFNNEYGF